MMRDNDAEERPSPLPGDDEIKQKINEDIRNQLLGLF